MKVLKHRKTPWDQAPKRAIRASLVPSPERSLASASETAAIPHKGVLCLHGLYVFDPCRSTSADFRQFLWAGLRVLRSEGQARGLSKEQVRRLLVSAFDLFHDAAEGLWIALKNVVSESVTADLAQEAGPAQTEPFVAFEEDRPVPLQMEYREPLELLDPDAALLSSPGS